MYPSIMECHKLPLDFELLSEVSLKLLVDVIDDGTATVLLVDLVPIPGSAHYRQTQLDIALL